MATPATRRFRGGVALWHEPDQFKPSDADVVGSLYDVAASDGMQQRSANSYFYHTHVSELTGTESIRMLWSH